VLVGQFTLDGDPAPLCERLMGALHRIRARARGLSSLSGEVDALVAGGLSNPDRVRSRGASGGFYSVQEMALVKGLRGGCSNSFPSNGGHGLAKGNTGAS